MSRGVIEFYSGVAVGVLAMIFIAGIVTIKLCERIEDLENHALNLGHAEWYLDDDHHKKWRWKPKGDE